MRHRAKVSTFGRKSGPRKALIRGLVSSLVAHGRIKTTLAKAKELRRHVERAVTTGKDQTLSAQRLLLSRYPNEKTVAMLMKEIAPRFKDRNGGYTRILKLGNRAGDNAEMAYIEFVDYQPSSSVAPEAEEKQNKMVSATSAAQAKRRRIRKLQSAARKVQRT